ncbi:MAG: phosphate ABC transporter permease PstA [Planctomycetota bacterium]|jgi:phosphate transport system permease protein
MSEISGLLRPRLQRRRRLDLVLRLACLSTSLIGLAFLLVLIVRVAMEGAGWFSLKFLTNFPSVLNPENAGVKSALYGTVWLISITALVSVPIGVAAAIYLEEYAPNNRITRLIHLNIANLAGVPSVVYGILGLTVFVRWFYLDRSVLSGAFTLSLLIMPVIIITSREALVAVPQTMRHAALALGASKWQTVYAHVLPYALPNILTGVILAVSRAIGEAAPLLMIGALTYIAFVPEGPRDMFTALPIQIYDWCDKPQKEFHHLAAAGIILMLGVLLPINGIAVGIRAWQRGRVKW